MWRRRILESCVITEGSRRLIDAYFLRPIVLDFANEESNAVFSIGGENTLLEERATVTKRR